MNIVESFSNTESSVSLGSINLQQLMARSGNKLMMSSKNKRNNVRNLSCEATLILFLTKTRMDFGNDSDMPGNEETAREMLKNLMIKHGL